MLTSSVSRFGAERITLKRDLRRFTEPVVLAGELCVSEVFRGKLTDASHCDDARENARENARARRRIGDRNVGQHRTSNRVSRWDKGATQNSDTTSEQIRLVRRGLLGQQTVSYCSEYWRNCNAPVQLRIR